MRWVQRRQGVFRRWLFVQAVYTVAADDERPRQNSIPGAGTSEIQDRDGIGVLQERQFAPRIVETSEASTTPSETQDSLVHRTERAQR